MYQNTGAWYKFRSQAKHLPNINQYLPDNFILRKSKHQYLRNTITQVKEWTDKKSVQEIKIQLTGTYAQSLQKGEYGRERKKSVSILTATSDCCNYQDIGHPCIQVELPFYSKQWKFLAYFNFLREKGRLITSPCYLCVCPLSTFEPLSQNSVWMWRHWRIPLPCTF
jgi:hypothetical protein